MDKVILFEKEYDDESLIDLQEHIYYVLEEGDYDLPTDKYGFRRGTFKVIIEWTDEELDNE